MTMPAGTYYIGDLCYVMDEEWDEFCTITIDGHNCIDGEFALSDGRRFATYGTKYGDGAYTDQFGNQYGVDAGLIGCIKVDDIRGMSIDSIGSMGNVVVFDKDFVTSGGRSDNWNKWDGVIHIGHIDINTDPVYDDEYEEEEY